MILHYIELALWTWKLTAKSTQPGKPACHELVVYVWCTLTIHISNKHVPDFLLPSLTSLYTLFSVFHLPLTWPSVKEYPALHNLTEILRHSMFFLNFLSSINCFALLYSSMSNRVGALPHASPTDCWWQTLLVSVDSSSDCPVGCVSLLLDSVGSSLEHRSAVLDSAERRWLQIINSDSPTFMGGTTLNGKHFVIIDDYSSLIYQLFNLHQDIILRICGKYRMIQGPREIPGLLPAGATGIFLSKKSVS